MAKKNPVAPPPVERIELIVQPTSLVTSYATQSNYDPEDTHSSLPVGESVTVPDMVLSIEELISRYSRGLPIPENAAVNVDMDVSDFAKMDKFDKLEMARRLKHRQSVLQNEIDEAGAAELKKQLDEEFERRVDEKLKSLNKKPDTLSDDK